MNISAEDAIEIEQLATDASNLGASVGHGTGSSGAQAPFRVRLDNFEGPFDLLLSLITRRQMDVTEVALSQVTDEFIAHLSASVDWDLGQATEFLVVASTLLDLKAARLLPAAEVEDDEDLALLEARDLLFARLLQYRAYKLAAAYLGELERAQARRHGRAVELEPEFAQLLPEVLIGIGVARLAALAALALVPKPVPVVLTDHVHSPQVSVREHMLIMRERLRSHGSLTFRSLVAGCASTLEVVARFLGLLELYRDGTVAFDQAAALAELRVRWTGGVGEAEERATASAELAVDEEYG
ncbi:MAG: segregation/condensation protein A [Actinomycetota bacterium]|nr:segregation/condensation protein A [Actinomycetota bacterium]